MIDKFAIQDNEDLAVVDCLYMYIKQLIESIAMYLDGSEKKLTELPLYCIHMSMQKSIYELAMKIAIAQHELSIDTFNPLARKYADKPDVYIKEYASNCIGDSFSFANIDFKEYPIKLEEKRTALEDLCNYTKELGAFLANTSLASPIIKLPLLKPEKINGLYYLDTESGLEAALLKINEREGIVSASEILGYKEDTQKKLNYSDLFDADKLYNREILEEADAYFEELYTAVKGFLTTSHLKQLLEPLFITLLRIEFGNNLEEAVLSTKNKYKDLNIKINNETIASLINVDPSTFSNYGTKKFPSVDGLYRIADVLGISSDKLLGKVSQDNPTEEYIYEKYGLDSETLRHLEQFKSLKDANGTDTSFWLNGLNKCLQSIKYDYYAVGKNKINFLAEEIQQLQLVHKNAIELISNDSVPTEISNGHFIKKVNGLEVRYTKAPRYIKNDNIVIKMSNIFTSYEINGKLLTHKKNDEVMYIKYEGITNTISYNEYLKYIKNDYKCNPPVQYHVIGNTETDFFSALCRYLNNKTQQVCTISQKDFDYMLDECANNRDEFALPDIESFLQDMYSEYGYTKYETDNLNMLEIADKLKKFKESLSE